MALSRHSLASQPLFEVVDDHRAGRAGCRPDGISAEIRAMTFPPKPLALLVDAMLLPDNTTMRGILRELQRKASAACRGKDLRANIRARIYWLKNKGIYNGGTY